MRALLLALTLALGLAPAAAAAPSDAHRPAAGNAVATASVLVGGRQVALLGPAAGFTPQQRALRMRQALERAAAMAPRSPRRPADVAVAMVLGAPVVTWRGAHMITATAADARLAGREPGAVAAAWAAELRAALGALDARDFDGQAILSVAIVPGTAVFHGGGAGAGQAPPRR